MIRLLAVFLFVLSYASCCAQFQWGTRTGFQLSTLQNFSPSESSALDWRPKYLIPSFYFQWEFKNSLAVSTELSFATKGAKSQIMLGSRPADAQLVLPYITVPILLHYNMQHFSVFAGGEFGYKFKSTYKSGATRQEDLLLTHPIDIGITGGIGYRLSDEHTLMARYTHGLINVISEDAKVLTFDGEYILLRENGYGFHNRTIQLSLSTAFRYSGPSEKRRKVNFDLRQGFGSYSLFTVDDNGFAPFESDRKAHYESALEMNVQIKKYFHFNTGINYITKTSKMIRNVKFNYLSVPIFFGVSPIVSDVFRLTVQGGVGVNFTMNNTAELEKSFGMSDETYDVSTSFLYAVEGQIPIKKKLSLVLVYRNSWDNDGPYRQNFADYKFRGYSVSAGVRYHLNAERKDETETDDSKEPAAGNESRFGIKAGLNFQWLHASKLPEYLMINEKSSMPFWHAGVFYNIRLGKSLSIVPELSYTKRSTVLKSVDLPVMLSRKVGKHGSFEVGPQMVFFFAKPKLESEGPYQLYLSKLTDFGVAAGARYQITKNLELAARYFHGVTDTAGLLTADGYPVSFEGFNRTVMLSTYLTLARKKSRGLLR